MDNKEIGYKGEDITSRYLEKHGYTIIKRNYCIRGGEIDIIAQDNDYLVFVEVKTRNDHSLASGLEAITKRKQSLIIKTAEDFLYKNPTNLQPRFDVAEVIFSEGIIPKIRYITNAFYKNQ